MIKLLLSALTLVYFTVAHIPHAVAQNTAAQGTPAQESAKETMTTTTTTTATPAMPAYSDGESAEVLVTLNEGEIEVNQLAKRKATNKQVKDFAKMMVDQHKQNEKDTKKLARKQDIDFKKTDMSKSLQAQAKDMENTLKKTSKEDFDRTYMNSQVMMHEKALETVNALITGAQNPAYKTHLEKTRDAITVHLSHAKEVQSLVK